MAKKISANAYAKHRGVSGEAVKKAIQQGRITASPDKKGQYHIDPKVADKEWEENTRPSKPKEAKKTKKEIEKEQQEIESEADSFLDQASGKLSYAQARTMKENYNAKLAKIKFEEQSGILVSADKVKDDAFKMARAVRNQILALPDRIAGELASMKDARTIALKLTKELAACLESLSNEEQ